MDIAAYVDGIIELLVEHGVSRDRADAEMRAKLEMAFSKGRDWTAAAIAACQHFGIPVQQ